MAQLLRGILLLCGILLPLVIGPLSRPANAQETGCSSELPALREDFDAQAVLRMPVSASHPDHLTEVRLSMVLLAPEVPQGPWVAEIHAFFPDPKPFGIPYSFEKLSLEWASSIESETPFSATLDWTLACSQVGRSIFPGQTWTQRWEIPGTQGLLELKNARVSVFGQRE